MRNVLWTCLTIFFFFLLVLSFGLPGKMSLIERNPDVNGKCMVGEKRVSDVSGTLSHQHPELVLLGNSMLGEAVGQEEMSQAAGLPIVKVWLKGSGSAWWYLVIKNIVSEMPHKPKYIGIIFRDNYLTLPQHRVSGRHRSGIDAFAGAHEEILDQLAYFNSMNSIELAVQKYLPLFNHRMQIRETFERNLQQLTANIMDVRDARKVKKLVATAFDNDKMNPVMLERRQLADEFVQDEYRKDMSFHPEKSFLDHVIKLCESQGITLFFVRVKRSRDLKAGKQSPDLLKYMSLLHSYLSEKNIPLIDFTFNKQVLKRHFGKGDHLNRGIGRTLFTQLLAEQIKRKVLAGKKDFVAAVKITGKEN